MANISIQQALQAVNAEKGSKDTVGTFHAEPLTVTVTDPAGNVVLTETMQPQCFKVREKDNTSGVGWMAKAESPKFKGLPLRCNLMLQINRLRLGEGDVLDLIGSDE